MEGVSEAAFILDRPRDAAEAQLIQASIEAALSGGYLEGHTGKFGLTIEVKMPGAEVPEAEVPGPQLEAVLVLRITENPLVNQGETGTGIHCEDAALILLQAFHQWHRDGRAVYADRRAIRDDELEDEGLIVFEVWLRHDIGVDIMPRVLAPVITFPVISNGSESARMLDIQCGSEGAVIYWTDDGTPPYATNENAFLYEGTFNVTDLEPGTVIRAAATKAGHLPSLIARKLIF